MPLARFIASIALVALSTSANATLIDNGDGTVTDGDLGIMWLKDANLAVTNTFGIAGITSLGYMDWKTANDWIAAMNAANYLGYDNWRLPTTEQPYCLGYLCGPSEMSHLFYSELGLPSGANVDLVNDPDTVQLIELFEHLRNASLLDFYYWNSPEALPDYDPAFSFNNGGYQTLYSPPRGSLVWAVRSISAVPEPATFSLLGLGLLGLGCMRRRYRR